MATYSLTLRSDKGSKLTTEELDSLNKLGSLDLWTFFNLWWWRWQYFFFRNRFNLYLFITNHFLDHLITLR